MRTYVPKGLPGHKPDTRKGDRHKSRRKGGKPLSKWARGRFVAWDTEGANVRGRHTTIVIANNVDRPLVDPLGLSSLDILRYLTEHADKLATHVSFVFSYDVNMILADAPKRIIARLWAGQAAYWGDYRLEYRPRKSFSVRDTRSGRGLTIWDVFGFCQSSFVKAVKAYGLTADLTRIEAMKQRRSEFRPEDIDEIAAYCKEECVLLAELSAKIRDYFSEAGLNLTRFDGAGAAASALLRREGVEEYRVIAFPADVEEASRFAYFGGRVESPQYGRTDAKVYRYDINSAYPSAAVTLPCLRHGKWHHDTANGFTTEPFTLYRVRWHFERENAVLFPFAWRARDGRVYYPPKGEGWYWSPEVEAAYDNLKAYVGTIDILERWTFAPGCNHKPFAFIADLYRQRQAWKAAGIGAEKALKLAINSIYGKLAQQVGGRRVRGRYEPPRWHTLPWAGFITSTTRARVYRAGMQAPEHCLMIATDAVYSTRRLRLDCGTGLGQWEPKTYEGFTLVQSGVYWAGNELETPSGSRGFDALSLDRDAIVRGWKAGDRTYTATHTKFVGMGEALATNWARWRTWQEGAPRELKLTPTGTKREPLRGAKPHLRLCPTLAVDPRPLYGTAQSAPLERPWDNEPTILFTTREDEESDAWRL